MNRRVTAMILSAAIFPMFFAVPPVRAQKAAEAPAVRAEMNVPAQRMATRMIVVSLQDRRLALVENGVVTAVYPVAVGKTSTPSPTGTFTIVNHIINPTYYHHGEVIPAGPENPVGNRWMGLNIPGYGIHGTNVQRSIGKAVSHGCIRVGRRNLEKLFAQVRVGDTVEIIGTRDEQTEALFGVPATPQNAHAPVLTAKNTPETAPAQSGSTTAAVVAVTIPAGQ
jgi:lipoprotein-anchoring transpeptidase ErfK/SrfK